MKIVGASPNLGPNRAIVGHAVQRVRILNGNLPSLGQDERIHATVMEVSKGQAVLNVNGSVVTVAGIPTLEAGMEVVVSLPADQRSTPQPGQAVVIHVATRSRLSDQNGHVPVSPEIIDRPGTQTVEDAVVELLAHRIAQVASPGQTIADNYRTLLTAGEPSKAGKLPPSFMQLGMALKGFLAATRSADVESIAQWFRDGGLQYEAKLARRLSEGPQVLARVANSDLKGLLLQALRDIDRSSVTGGLETAATAKTDAASTELARLGRSVVDVVNHFDEQQARNVLAKLQGEPFQFRIPFMNGEDVSTAFVMIDADDQEETPRSRQTSGYSLYFHLELDRFGDTRIDAQVTHQGVRAIIYVENPSVVKELRSELTALQKSLETAGFKDVVLLVKTLRNFSLTTRQKFDALESGIPTTVQLLDVKA